jgi:hypothetical protein
LRKNLVPLPPDADLSLEAWLSGTNYPEWRKKELREAYDAVIDIREKRKYFECKSFMKDEWYLEWKHVRGINSRSDVFKAWVGPTFKLIENVVYKNPSFIKHVPVRDRARYIMDLLYIEGGQYFASDYTAFESLFTKEMMESCEFQLYEYMTKALPNHVEFMGLCRDVLAGTNICRYKHFSVKLEATRMSGEMCTSLGNGFSNLMFMLFVCKELGCKDVVGVVEGDDGAFRVRVPKGGRLPEAADFARLGLVIKPEYHNKLSTMSFCGLIFDPEDQLVVTDPREVIASMGWTVRQYARCKSGKLKALLRCKALSYAHQYPGCPIIQSMAHYVLRVTRSVDVRGFVERRRDLNMWERDQLLAAMADEKNLHVVEVPSNTRFLVEDVYNIPVHHQTLIESYLDSLDKLVPLTFDLIKLHMPASWKVNWEQYARAMFPQDPDLERPPEDWPVNPDWDPFDSSEFRSSWTCKWSPSIHR